MGHKHFADLKCGKLPARTTQAGWRAKGKGSLTAFVTTPQLFVLFVLHWETPLVSSQGGSTCLATKWWLLSLDRSADA